MGTITTAMTTSSKAEYMQGAHCVNATVTPTASSSSSVHYTSVSSMAGVCVGMSMTGTNVAAGSVVTAIVSATAFDASLAATGSISGGTITISGDAFNIALIKNSPSGSYGATTVNYTDVTGASDEVTGTGYTAGGVVLTNVTPVTSGTTGFLNWSPNPSWTSASFSTAGCIIFNSSARLGGTSGTNTTGGGRALGVWDFGGTQTVSSGTLTILFPSATSSTAIIRIG